MGPRSIQQMVEKHITLDKALEGTDHILSADPVELATMIREIRLVERMLGDGTKALTPLEAENQKFLRERFQHGGAKEGHGVRPL